ncbi:CBU_0592 family membrane protein [Luteimonas sp. SDU101]|uniref:CBU_0592 family membrane protein n=1 Tax=unclassified Luteimonas TaxID=2629088 RepID=UPI003EBF68B4
MVAALAWQDWVGFAGAGLMLLALFLHLFAPRADGGGRLRAMLGLLGAAALLPVAVLRFSPPLFFLLVAWVLMNAYRVARAPRDR